LANISIYEKIENKGLQDARKIQETGSKKALDLEFTILGETRKQIETAEKKNAEITANLLKTKETEFEQAARQVSLARRKTLIDAAFERAHARLKKCSDTEWEKLVLKMLSADELTGSEIIVPALNDRERFLSRFSSNPTASPIVLDRLNAALRAKKYHLTLSVENASIDGGFLVLGTDFDINHSYATMLSELKDRQESEVASLLFDGVE